MASHAHSMTSTGTVIYEPVGQSEKKHGVTDTVVPIGSEPSSNHTSACTTRSLQFLCAVTSTCLVPLVAITVWGGLNTGRPRSWTALSGAPIGGRLTQPQAKAVDVLCSAVLAPLLMATLNYVWFTCARTAAVTEYNSRATSLRTLSVASSSATGSYDLFNLWELVVKSKAPRLMLLGCLVLSAAVTNTALTNIIAYEAYMVEGASSTVKLQYLQDDMADQAPMVATNLSLQYSFDDTQTSSLAKGFTGMLTGLSYADASSVLNQSEYYMVNATSASLNALPANIIDMPGVPAVKYGIQCEAATPSNTAPIQQGEKLVSITFTLNATASHQGLLFNAYYPGKVETIQDAYNEHYYSFMGFTPGGNNYTYMLFTTSFDESNDTLTTPYGIVQPVAINMTALGFKGTKSTMSWWGMCCWLKRTPGTAGMRRGNDSSWAIRSYTWHDDKGENVDNWAMKNLQTALDYSAPGSTVPGIGPALARRTYLNTASGPDWFDYPITAQNMMYAECETKRMIYEIAATNQSRAQPHYFYQAAAKEEAEFYRMTYVPLILFFAIGSMVLGAAISFWLMISALRSESARSMRKVDVLRLVVDSTAGLKDDNAFLDVARESNSNIADWAGGYPVRYRVRQADSHGGAQVMLVKENR